MALVSNSTKDYSRKKDIGGKMEGKATTQAVCMGRSSPGPQQGKAFANKSTKKVEFYRCLDTQEPVPFCFPNKRANPAFFTESLRAVKPSQPCR